MATTTILQPQDCLRRNPASPSFVLPAPRRDRNTLRVRRRKHTSLDNNNAGNVNNNNKHVVEGRRLVVPRFPTSGNSHLVMGQVRILKRGEELAKKPMMKIRAAAAVVDRGFDAVDGGDEDLVLSSTDRLGPDPETVQKHVRVSDGLYAGPASLLASPPPSSLPFPAFFAKERKNDVATSDLRRLLRLDLA